jgi:hypothetical protein
MVAFNGEWLAPIDIDSTVLGEGAASSGHARYGTALKHFDGFGELASPNVRRRFMPTGLQCATRWLSAPEVATSGRCLSYPLHFSLDGFALIRGSDFVLEPRKCPLLVL